MGNGRYNINLASLSVLCYLLVLIGQVEALFLVAGFIILVEKNEKAVIQSIQAVGLLLVKNIIIASMSRVTLGMAGVFDRLGIYRASLRMEEMAIGTGGLVGAIVNIAAIGCIVFIVMKKPLEVPFIRLVLNEEGEKQKSTVEE